MTDQDKTKLTFLAVATSKGLGEILYAVRNYVGETQKGLGKTLGTDDRAVRRLESGRASNPTLKTVYAIANALGYEPHLEFRPKSQRPEIDLEDGRDWLIL